MEFSQIKIFELEFTYNKQYMLQTANIQYMSLYSTIYF